MSNPEIKILRDERAKVIADIKRRDSAIEQLTRALEERDRIITEMMMENDSLKRHLKIYENPHAPPSHGSVPAQQRKARSAKGAGPPGNKDATEGDHGMACGLQAPYGLGVWPGSLSLLKSAEPVPYVLPQVPAGIV